MFLKVYGDESYDKRLYCCGSFLGFPESFYYLGLQWEDRLKKDNIAYFRSFDCENLFDQFGLDHPPGYGLSQARARAESIYHDLVEIVRSDVIGGIAASVVRKDFEELVAENPKAKKCFGTDLMIFTYKRLIKATVALMERDWAEKPNLKIGFLFDEHSNYRVAEEAYEQLKTEDVDAAKRMLVAGHADDRDYPGLQMADLMAYEARIKTNAWLNASPQERRGFAALKETNNIYFMGLMDREHLLGALAEEFPEDE